MIIWIQGLVQHRDATISSVLGTVLPNGDQEGMCTYGPVGPLWTSLSHRIGIVSIALFWTYMEIGVGFCVACLPPCAHLLDRLTLAPIISKLRSLSSLFSALRRSGGSQCKEKPDLESNFPRTPESLRLTLGLSTRGTGWGRSLHSEGSNCRSSSDFTTASS